MSFGRVVLYIVLAGRCLADFPGSFRLPTPTEFTVKTSPARLGRASVGGEPTLTAHPVDAPDETWVFTARIALKLETGVALEAILAGRRLDKVRTIDENLFVLQAPDAVTAWTEAESLARVPGVIAAFPVYHAPRTVTDRYAPAPNDELFRTQLGVPPCEIAPGVIVPGQIVSGQWYLENRDPATGAEQGVDLNIRPAWAESRGEGVIVAVADTGVDLGHADLRTAVASAPHFNFSTGLPNGSPIRGGIAGTHGTSVAGMIAATANNSFGMSGVAPGAEVAAWVIFDSAGFPINGERFGDLFRFASNQVAIQNHSWAPVGVAQRGPDALEDAGLQSAWTEGRGGLGTVLVFAAGNGRLLGKYANDNGFASDPRTIGVSGVNPRGRATANSEPGSSMLVAAPAGDDESGGLFTTDLTSASGFEGANFLNYCPPFEYLTDFRWGALGFKDTSSAVPQIAGIAALMLSVNPQLTARDVQQVLILSARHFDLTDPDLTTNGVGLAVSHNVGFGIVNAAEAVRLAQHWSNRPAATRLAQTISQTVAVPDGGYRIEVEGSEIPSEMASISGLSGFGIQPDRPMMPLPLMDLGRATNAPPIRLDGHGALIERGDTLYDAKLRIAAEAGAEFGIIYNLEQSASGSCPGGDQLCVPTGTDYSPIPVIFIGRTAGLALRELIRTNASTRVRIALNGSELKFNVAETWQCDRVGVRLKTDFSVRGDLRITLTSPAGTTSILQRYNGDSGRGPVDWTYWSTHHYFESSRGTWTLKVTDEAPGEGTGQILEASLILDGVPILDSDHDGLDDNWEHSRLASLDQHPEDDSDQDGYNNLRESVEGTDPTQDQRPTIADVSFFSPEVVRLSWPGRNGENFRVSSSDVIGEWHRVTEVPGRFPVTATMLPASNANGLFRVEPTAATAE